MAHAARDVGTEFSPGVTKDAPSASAYGLVTMDKKAFLDACEDQDASVCMVRILSTRSGKIAADTQISAVPAYVESITIAPNDSVSTSGTIVLYDNTAESGTELFRYEVTTTYFQPVTIPIHASAATGLYLGFTTTTDVNVWVNYRAN